MSSVDCKWILRAIHSYHSGFVSETLERITLTAARAQSCSKNSEGGDEDHADGAEESHGLERAG